MVKGMKRWLAATLVVALALQMVWASAVYASADAEMNQDYTPYVSLGADLTEEQRKTVLDLLGVSEEELQVYKTVQITNQDEHDYLGDYMSASVIGDKALSSVFVVKLKDGSGIGVDTHNITYCTPGMYCNALITAGLTDADVVVAGPFEISGTAALVGAMKAYAVMTGEDISRENMDAATNELVVTGELAQDIGDSEKTEQLIAAVKKTVFEENLANETEIREAVNQCATALEVPLTEEDVDKIVDLMNKINELDLDVESIKEQAKGIYDKLADVNFDFDFDKEGLLDKVGSFFGNIFSSISDFFKGLFS